MAEDSDYQYLLNASFRFLSFRPRSEKEFRDFLSKKIRKQKIYGPILVDKLVDRLRELGYVDDQKFASWWVSQRQGRKPKGKIMIARELSSKGVARDVAEQVLYSELTDQKELAIKALEKKSKTVTDRKKLMDFLIRRGFDGGTARSAIDDLEKIE